MRDNFTFGSVNSLDHNVHIFDLNTDLAPSFEVNEIAIPGRNGTLLLSGNRMENVEHRYVGVIYEDAEENLRWFRDAIMQHDGYQRLEDTIHPEEFYKARYIGGLQPKLTSNRDMVKFVIEFSRKPQRFLKSGERKISVTSSGFELNNPTAFSSRPLIKVSGNGSFVLGGNTVTITGNTHSYLHIDSELMDCYFGSMNCNQYVTFSTHEFPVIPSGKSTITYSDVSNIEITPRWFTA